MKNFKLALAILLLLVIIVVGGGVGTLSELCLAYWNEISIVCIKGTGDVADEYAGKKLDKRKKHKIEFAENAESAFRLLMRLIKKRIK